jgi:biopolymer transport protein ExbB
VACSWFQLALLLVLAVFFSSNAGLPLGMPVRWTRISSIIRDHIVTGNVTAARSLSKNTPNPVARMIDKGIQRIEKPIDAIEKSMENVGKLEVYKMEKIFPSFHSFPVSLPCLDFWARL